MRLAQIARKVGKTPQEIARFLNEQVADPIEKDPNFKLTEAQVNAVMDEFEPEVIEEPAESKMDETPENTEEKQEESTLEEELEVPAAEETPLEVEKSPESTEELINETPVALFRSSSGGNECGIY